MYDPSIGRWLEPDPEGFKAGDSNLERYVGNDPTNATDPSGLAEEPQLRQWERPIYKAIPGWMQHLMQKEGAGTITLHTWSNYGLSESLFKQLDPNGDGQITLRELQLLKKGNVKLPTGPRFERSKTGVPSERFPADVLAGGTQGGSADDTNTVDIVPAKWDQNWPTDYPFGKDGPRTPLRGLQFGRGSPHDFASWNTVESTWAMASAMSELLNPAGKYRSKLSWLKHFPDADKHWATATAIQQALRVS